MIYKSNFLVLLFETRLMVTVHGYGGSNEDRFLFISEI